MKGHEDDFESVFRQIVKNEAIASDYRDRQRKERHRRELREYSLFSLMVSFLSARLKGRKGNSGAGRQPRTQSDTGIGLALDRQKAEERKSLYVREERIAVYTSLFGPYDKLREPLMRPDNIDYYLITDQLVSEGGPWGSLAWRSVIPPQITGDPVLANRWCKTHPHLLFPDYQYSVYVDANIWILSDLTPLAAGLDDFPIAMFLHKKRDCVYEEVRACVEQKKDSPEALSAHEEVLRGHGIPPHWGLLEASIIARKHLDDRCVDLMESWWDSFLANSRRDQISLVDTLWTKGIEPARIGTLGANLQRCDLFIQLGHSTSDK